MATRAAWATWIALGATALAVLGVILIPRTEPTDPSSVRSTQEPAQPPAAAAQPAPRPAASLERVAIPATNQSKPREFSVDLGDGTSLKVAAHPMRVAGIKRPERLADVVDELVRLAEAGDVAAQYSLGRWLKECRRTYSDGNDLEKAIARLQRDGIEEKPVTSDLPAGKGPVSDVAGAEAGMRRHFAFCEGVPAERRGEAGDWLEQAASSGFLPAMLEQAGPFASDHETRYKIFETAWRDHGHVASLESLIGFYRRGWHPGGEPDNVLAYAYAFANLKVNEAIFANSVYPAHRNRLVALQDSLANLASYLAPQQTAEAEALGRRLLRENPNCCVSFSFGQTH